MVEKDVALCISGQMRTYKECYGYLKRNVIEPLDPDIFIHTWEDTGVTTKVDVEDPETEKVRMEDLEKIYNPKNAQIEKFKDDYFEEFEGVTVPDELKDLESKHWKGNIPLFYKIKKCNELKKAQEKKRGAKYDLVIRIRPDLLVRKEIPKKILENPNKLWHSECQINTSFQVSDKFAISSSENMDYYASVWSKLNDYWKNPLGNGEKENFRIGERLMYQHFENHSSINTKSFNLNCEILRSEMFLKEKYSLSVKKIIRHIKEKFTPL